MRVLSLGAGVQSSTLALMMAEGSVAPADHAIFADTQAEPPSVMRWLDWLEKLLPFPVHRVTFGDLRAQVIRRASGSSKGSGGPPFFTDSGMLPRQCTRDFKLVPIERKLRELCGVKGRHPNRILADSIIGISYDEVIRMKPSRLKFVRNVFPLVDMKMTRWHCLEWMRERGMPQPPKSACTFCPYRSDEGWQTLKLADPEAFADACAVDAQIRGGFVNMTERVWVHRDRLPLADVDFSAGERQSDMWGNECEGMCGV